MFAAFSDSSHSSDSEASSTQTPIFAANSFLDRARQAPL